MHCPWLAFLTWFNGARFRGTGNMEHLSGITVLIRFDADGLHHLAPFLSFVRDKRAKVGSRTRKRRATQISEPRLDLGIGKARIDLVVELIDDLDGCVLGNADAIPLAGLVARQELTHGRKVRQRRRALRGRYS